MFKTGLVTYLKNLKFIFTVVGVLFLVLLIGLTIIIPSMVNDAQVYGNTLVTTINSYNIDGQSVVNKVRNVIVELNWDNPVDTLSMIFTEEWLTKTFNYCLGDIPQTVKEQIIPNIINISFNYASLILEGLLNIVLTILIGTMLSFFATKVIIDSVHIQRRFILLYAASVAINTIVVTGCTLLVLYCFFRIDNWTYAVIAGLIVLLVVLILFSAYFTESHRRVKLKEVINFNNFFQLLLVSLLMFAISFSITYVIDYFVNTPTAVIVGIPLFVVTFIVASETARIRVNDISQSRKIEKQKAQAQTNE